MKKKLFKILVLLSIIFFSACSDSITNNPEQDDFSLLSKNVGNWHNKALALTYNTNKTLSSVEEIRNNIIDALEKENNSVFNENTIKRDLALMKYNPYKKTLNKVTGDSTLTLNISDVFTILRDTGEISDTLYSKIMYINNDIDNGNISSDEELLARTQSLTDIVFTDKDKYFLDIYMQVINSSHEYWNLEENSLGKVQLRETYAVIWADAAGAAYGLLGTPIWSIIEGAIFSTVAAANYE